MACTLHRAFVSTQHATTRIESTFATPISRPSLNSFLKMGISGFKKTSISGSPSANHKPAIIMFLRRNFKFGGSSLICKSMGQNDFFVLLLNILTPSVLSASVILFFRFLVLITAALTMSVTKLVSRRDDL
uniref:(northern house mosquito) hypothetical protein n=1 Tax=Culex pipiens TaxID=7175 RepID=A0A8D8D6W8_CULPI